jgi:hypothetical protein
MIVGRNSTYLTGISGQLRVPAALHRRNFHLQALIGNWGGQGHPARGGKKEHPCWRFDSSGLQSVTIRVLLLMMLIMVVQLNSSNLIKCLTRAENHSQGTTEMMMIMMIIMFYYYY